MLTLLLILVVVACLLIEGFFSGSETAIISADRTYLRAEARRGNRRAALAERLLQRAESLLSTTLVGTNLAVVTGTSVATLIVARYVSPDWESVVTTAIMAPLILIVGEIVPKSIARASAHRITLRVAGPLRAVQRVMFPVIAAVGRIADSVLTVLGSRARKQSPYVTREELKALAALGEEHGVLVSDERRMILSVLGLHERPVGSVMVPLVDMASLPREATAADLEALAERTGFTRFPVYDKRVDNIVGLVSVVDVFRAQTRADAAATPIAPLIHRDVAFVPETKPVGELLRELRFSPSPMAIVVEEHGGVVGLVTIDDLVEEIVGRIRDERHDGPVDLIAPDSLSFECEGSMEVNEFSELTGLTIRKEGFTTVAGLVMKLCGHIPEAGEEVAIGPLRIEVLEVRGRRLRRLRVTHVVPEKS